MGVRYEADEEGGNTGVIELVMNNDDNDQNEKVYVTITFETAVIGLTTIISDIDYHSSYDDDVEITSRSLRHCRHAMLRMMKTICMVTRVMVVQSGQLEPMVI